MQTIVRPAVVLTVLLAGVAPGAAQTILGNKFDLRDRPGLPQYRRISIRAQEDLSPELVTGDPATNGATVQIIVSGTTPSDTTISLPPGSRWRGVSAPTPLDKGVWKYTESSSTLRGGRVSPVRGLGYARSGSGKFKLLMSLDARYIPLDVAAPNIGTYAGIVLTIGGGGPTYCVNFAGAAGGIIRRNDAVSFSVSKPTAEGVCPNGSAVCGDGVVDSPYETCDVGNDAACPGLCGANGLGCLCPYCGDAVIDPGESCDTQGHLGSCTEGCSYTCTCAVCGDGIIQSPIEDCDASTCYGDLLCAPPGAPNQCRCPVCGDDVKELGEQCEASDDSACPGRCIPDTCTCAVCGNNVQETGEQCDGSDGCATCLPNCTCAECGNGTLEVPVEQCEASDDSACPGHCNLDCVCGVCGNNFTDYPQEQCDGNDDTACLGACQPDCTCP